ncbi:hypothetical protein K435DRAFT_800978 [Dendrothele bispora CBS 962.96]|uniref:Uncharacterized protein n=1 Tax=Dendrothele bispora (strain CBS 962.96) TaxID=1314807 RepID=A0A4S8LS03_DENBC|nr:hypothetical protein K435DRAFT_800978 [Dendrothele bispora CBS 962.96]
MTYSPKGAGALLLPAEDRRTCMLGVGGGVIYLLGREIFSKNYDGYPNEISGKSLGIQLGSIFCFSVLVSSHELWDSMQFDLVAESRYPTMMDKYGKKGGGEMSRWQLGWLDIRHEGAVPKVHLGTRECRILSKAPDYTNAVVANYIFIFGHSDLARGNFTKPSNSLRKTSQLTWRNM